jgi:hypothetical protein
LLLIQPGIANHSRGLKRHLPVEDENAVRVRAARWPQYSSLSDLDPETLRGIASNHGLDFATAVLYDRAAACHSEFISRIDRMPKPSNRVNATVAIVPASFYKEKPHSGADGRVVRQAAIDAGLPSETVPVLSTGTLRENSAILLDWLANRPDEKIILVSLCKGGADVKYALSDPKAATAFRNVRAWLNVCGTLSGSPVAAWLVSRKLRFLAAWLFFKCSGHNFEFLRELAPSPRGPLASPPRIPNSMSLISVVGFPLRRHLTNSFMRACHSRIAPLGPNDGGVLLADVCQLPGFLYPVWGADHYLRPESRGRSLLAAILEHLKGEQSVLPVSQSAYAGV